MSGQGFDTWVLEVRGSGLSVMAMDEEEDYEISSVEDKVTEIAPKSRSKLSENFMNLSERLSKFFEGQNSAISNQIRDLSEMLADVIEENQQVVSPPQVLELQERFSTTLEDFLKEVDLIVKYDWDFDNYLEEDLPAVVRWNT